MQIKKLADELGVQVTLIKNFLRSHPAGKGRTFAGAEESLDREQERAVRDAHAAGLLKRNRGATTDVDVEVEAPEREVDATDLDGLKAAAVARWPLLARGEETHAVFAHEDVLRWLLDSTTPVEQRKIFTRRVQELMAHGVATRMKTVRGKNAGWLRTPLGGNSGNHYYLWLTNQGDSVRGQEEATRTLHASAPRRSRFLRLARHHEETSDVLDVGRPSDYARLPAQKALEGNDDGLVEPLVEAQRAAVDDQRRVRILVGRPGAGKTTALQAAASTLSGRALYVTWSPALAARAKEWFAAFGPAELEVEVWTFRELLARVDPSRSLPAELSLPASVEELRRHAEPVLPPGPWRHRNELRAEELYAELHAHLIGAAMPVAFAGRRACAAPVLSDGDYRSLREKIIGVKAIDGAQLVLRKLPPDVVRRLFAAPVAAFERARGLQDGSTVLDARFSFDWVLVDEVQDLTLAEQWLLVDVAARSGKARGVMPGMVVAGDEAQTVRPTAFAFGPLANMIEKRLGARAEKSRHELAQNLRSPQAVAELVDRADDVLYGLLPRVERPRGRRSDSPADVTRGKVATVVVDGDEELRRVLETFKELAGDAALVYPAALAPPDLTKAADDVGVTLWTSETIKGLEYRTIGVLDVPREVGRIVELAASTKDSGLSTELARTSIDRLLVALSRSTETLVLLGSGWDTAPTALREVLDDASETAESSEGHLGWVDLADLPELLEIDAADANARIEGQLSSSQRLQDLGQYDDAVREAENARGLLGPAGRPGSAGKDLRLRTHRRFAVASVAHALAGGPVERLRAASRSFRSSEAPRTATLITALAGAILGAREEGDTWKRAFEVAQGLRDLAVEEPSLVGLVVQRLRAEADSVDARHIPRTPAGRRALVEMLDVLAKDAPSDRDWFRDAHQRVLVQVLRHLITRTDKPSRDEYAALRTGVADATQLATLDAEHAEANGDLAGAARQWEEGGRLDAALRCARKIPDFETAARLAAAASSPDAPMIAWARDVAALLAARPASGALLDGERAALWARIEDTADVGRVLKRAR